MNPSPSQDIIDSAITTHRSFKNYDIGTICDGGGEDVGDNNIHSDDNITNKNHNTQRYTRAELHLLRYDARSRKRPECALRTELQNLGVWKFNIGNINQSNGNQSFIEPNNLNGLLTNTRSQRSPAARSSGGGVISSTSGDHSTSSPLTHNLSHHENQKAFIDHRSISSSHLMPAFAKRRIIASALNVSGSPPGNNGGNSVSYAGNSPLEVRSETSDCSKDLNYSGRPRGKEYIYDLRYQRSAEQSGFLSPQRRLIGGEHERDRSERSHEHEHPGPTSSISASSSRHGHHHNNMAPERRIGSGRLLPRDVNWDYRNQEKDKNVSSSIKKELPLTSHQLQQRMSGRFSERSIERSSGSFVDRRSFERRAGSNNDNSMREKHENVSSSSSSNTSGTRRFIGSEISPNSAENSSSYSHYHQQQPPPTASNPSRNRRNYHYNDRNDEPEWFSGGPTSQHETIELRGFEEFDDNIIGTGGGVSGYDSGNGIDVNKINQLTRELSGSSSSRTSSILNLSSLKKTKDLLDNPKDLSNVGKDVECSPNLVLKSTTSVATLEDEETCCIAGDNNDDKNDNCNTEMLNKFEGLFMNAIEKDNSNITSNANPEVEFNFETYCNLDPLDHTFMRSGDIQIGNDAAIISSSRFSRWFANKNNGEHVQSTNRNETQNEKDKVNNKSQVITLMEFLQRNKITALPEGLQPNVASIPSVEELEASMRKMDSNDSSNDSSSIKFTHSSIASTPVSLSIESSTEPSQDVEAFKKLLEQLGSANKHLHPPSIMQMNILMQQQQASRSTSVVPPQLNVMQTGGLIAPSSAPQSIPSHLMKNEEIKKIIQQQVVQQQHQNHHILPPHILQQQSTQQQNSVEVGNELSVPYILPVFSGQPQQQQQKRLEAHHLFQCVARGEIPLSFLDRELNNPNASAHTKDIIATVLRESSRSATPSTGLNANIPTQPIVNTNPNHLHEQQQQQMQSPVSIGGSLVSLQQQQHCVTNKNLVLSNSQIPNALLITGHSDQRPLPIPAQQGTGLPTPRDMHYHTQSILQNALFKKKFEEQHQQDALKRRQDIQKQHQQQSTMIVPPDLGEVQMLETQQKHLQQLQIVNSIPIQQQQQQQQQIQSHMQQQPRHMNSPTPLAFTPTSVLRKMTAEKENTAAQQQTIINQISHQQQQPHHQQTQNKSISQPPFVNQQQTMQQTSLQPRMILGGNHPTQQQPQQQNISSGNGTQNSSQQKTPPQLRNAPQVKWPPSHMINQNMSVNKPMGRPILKGPLPILPAQQQQQLQQPPPTSLQQQQQTSQMAFASKIEFQQIQQQRLKNNQTPQHISASQATTQIYPPHPMQQQQSPSPQQNQNIIISHVPQQQLFQQQQQQQRALTLQRQQQQIQICHQSQLHHHRNPQDVSIRTMGIAANTNANAISTDPATTTGIINYQRDGGLSPTSNQLAQWFSPELLAQASAGKLPLLNMNQALSLEEFERSIQHSSTVVNI